MLNESRRGNSRSILLASSSFLAIVLSVCLMTVVAAQGKFGVGLVPEMGGGDSTEKDLYQVVAEMPEVSQMFVIKDSMHMLSTLTSLKSHGRRPNYMVLAGHGSRATPGIKWGADDMNPQEIDLAANQKLLGIAQRALKNPGLVHMKPAQLKIEEASFQSRIALLQSAHGVMAPEGVVLLVNCSAAATPQGQKYVRDFGELLLGEDGGWIIAPRTDVSINLRSSILQRWWTKVLNGDDFSNPEFLIKAEWQAFRIEGKKKADGWKKMVGLWRSTSGATIRISCSAGNELSGVIVSVPPDSKFAQHPGSVSFTSGIPSSGNSIHTNNSFCFPKKKDSMMQPCGNCPMDITISADGQSITGKTTLYQYYDGSTTWDGGTVEAPVSWTRISD